MATNTFIIYHNPRCSKSRQTLALLEEHGLEFDVVHYLESPPNKNQLRKIIQKLGLTPRNLLRKGEAIYRELELGNQALEDEALLDAMASNPILIERPIITYRDRAVLGRPPENVVSLIQFAQGKTDE